MKTVLVTGASGGMGLAAAKRLTAAGCRVYGLDIRTPASVPEGMRFIRTDLTNEASIQETFAVLQRDGVRLDAIVHLAGIYELDSLAELEEAAFLRIFEVNLFAAYRVNRIFLPLLNKNARIVLTTSELARLDPLPFTGIYAVTKAALDKYGQALRMELQLLGHRVILLRPGAVDTGLLDVSMEKLRRFCETTALYRCNADRFRRIVERVEARKIPPEAVAELILRILRQKQPRYVYYINRNPLLILLNCLPERLQCAIIRGILK